ncbi:acetylornithine deacetylase [Hwanghaeella sp.]|uniref:acetylornithine deacetylase n=1 Tax=Hwanghaeella sp. TaxID=2605943 RepID=UPI003CCBF3CD
MPTSVEILEKLIAFDTVSRTPNRSLIDYVRGLLDQAGIESILVEDDAGHCANLYATVGGSDSGGVMLSGHTDVVPVTGQAWTVDPFKMTQRDGKLYGRGTTDMKGFVACAIRAAIDAANRPLATPLHLALSYDEEIGCVGVRRLLDMLDAAPVKPAMCIVGEPTELVVANGHKGKTAARAICTGLSVHSALAPTGVNAIQIGAAFIEMLRRVQEEIAASAAKDDAYDIPYTTVHAGIIAGGTALNIVPNECRIDFEIRNIQSDDPAAILRRIEEEAQTIAQNFGEGAGISIDVVNSYPGLDTPLDADIIRFVQSLTGANSTTKIAFGTEGGLFSNRLGIPTVVCGPGSMAQGHKPDEFITVDQMAKCDRMLNALVERLAA